MFRVRDGGVCVSLGSLRQSKTSADTYIYTYMHDQPLRDTHKYPNTLLMVDSLFHCVQQWGGFFPFDVAKSVSIYLASRMVSDATPETIRVHTV